jgi:hypothetical protein
VPKGKSAEYRHTETPKPVAENIEEGPLAWLYLGRTDELTDCHGPDTIEHARIHQLGESAVDLAWH